ncbi:phytoene/squalene synthase family protein [Agromyces sp. S2-1-8]|uniref:phytoene/squalene synthase family protein n=1 Tax=Agromyces sp. S2-1-8 TaxID=2897180 RepID=UPI001E6473FB|nr:phytoene/squalene synthase family protein [Agromyces sp. S2-1-8]MCD5345260.1 phytoene/squalene synthase family protein [Agromyces sp. S2-1-8]
MTPTGLDLYHRTARLGSARVITEYSTSFGLASRLCSRAVRTHVAAIYALVRIADEIVDGPAEEAGLDRDERRAVLDALEVETERAIRCGYSANLVVDAFAQTARATGFGVESTRPFFASMRRDLDPVDFDADELDAYVYGSAEVIGLMCLRAFSEGLPADAERDLRWQRGARHLGAAFQKLNFLRDLADDFGERGRRYLPGIDPAHLTEAQKSRVLDDIDRDLAIAGGVIAELPGGCRRAVAAAHGLFSELSARLRRTPAPRLVRERVSVPSPRKLALLLRSVVRPRRGMPRPGTPAEASAFAHGARP